MLVQYNRESYDVDINIARIDTKDTTKIVDSTVYTLYTDHISKITIINDLDTCYPSIEIEYNDIGSLSVTNYPSDGYTLMNFRMTLTSNDHIINLQHSFIIDDISIMSNNIQNIYFKITASSLSSVNLKSKIDYSTNNKLVSATKICKDILNQCKYPLDTVIDIDSVNKLEYITPVNYTVLKNIEYLMHYGSGDVTGIYYLIYNMIKQKGRVVSINQLFNQESLNNVQNYNKFIMPSKGGIHDQYTTMYDIKYNNFMKGSNTYEVAAKSTFNEFDYIKRKWSQNIFNFNRIDSSLPKLPNTYNTRSVYKDKPVIVGGNRFNSEHSTVSYPELFKKLDKLYKYYSDIQFNCFGNLNRDIGQIVQIDAFNNVVSNRYGGFYMIARIYHTFVRDNYTCNITALRTTEQNKNMVNNEIQ